ncbi:MAG: glycosyltransferase family 4 protein [Phycisphaerales bacterium]
MTESTTSMASGPVNAGTVDEGILVGAMSVLNEAAPVFLVAFLVTLVATPFVRLMAVQAGIIDKPDQQRKLHKYPVAYLGGLAVFLGLVAALGVSYAFVGMGEQDFMPVPWEILAGMTAIAFVGFLDDLDSMHPWGKVAGQLVAAALLCYSPENAFGTPIARGLLYPVVSGGVGDWLAASTSGIVTEDVVYYWVGIVLVAGMILGACNAANLIDGLDGLLTGTSSIMAVGFLAVGLLLAATLPVGVEHGQFVAARVVLALALLGALLGFLPWNFNPAVIFLGDCGSLLIGYLLAVCIMMQAQEDSISLFFAGLIIFALPIMDTLLAIIRRKLAGLPMSAADANHIHHQAKRLTGSVRKAVMLLYGVTAAFTLLGVGLAALQVFERPRVLVVYSIAFVLFAGLICVALKAALLERWQVAPRSEATVDPASGVVAEPAKPVDPVKA